MQPRQCGLDCFIGREMRALFGKEKRRRAGSSPDETSHARRRSIKERPADGRVQPVEPWLGGPRETPVPLIQKNGDDAVVFVAQDQIVVPVAVDITILQTQTGRGQFEFNRRGSGLRTQRDVEGEIGDAAPGGSGIQRDLVGLPIAVQVLSGEKTPRTRDPRQKTGGREAQT